MNNGRLNQDLALFTGCNIFGAGITLCALGCNLHGAIVAGYVVSGVSGWLLLASCCVGTCSDVVTDMQVVVARDVGPMVSGLVNGAARNNDGNVSAYFIVPVDPSITTIAEAQQPNSLTDAVPQVIGGALPMEQIAQFVGTLRENGDNPIMRNDVVVILSKSKIEALG